MIHKRPGFIAVWCSRGAFQEEIIITVANEVRINEESGFYAYINTRGVAKGKKDVIVGE